MCIPGNDGKQSSMAARRAGRVLLAAICVGAAASCASAPDPRPPAAAVDTASVEEYRIGPGDVLQISVWKQEALARTVPVRPDGMISLPLVNDVRAAGLTAMQLRGVLAEKLTGYVVNPEVSVVVQQVRNLTASVLGEVRKAGRYEFKNGATVLDLLASAGGITEFAGRKRIVLLRANGNSVKRIPFDYDRAIAPGGESENVQVQPGDIIVVP